MLDFTARQLDGWVMTRRHNSLSIIRNKLLGMPTQTAVEQLYSFISRIYMKHLLTLFYIPLYTIVQTDRPL